MYVVRLTLPDGRLDFKAFVARPDAVKRFEGGADMTWDGRLEHAALFEVPGVSDPREAFEVIKAGKAVLLDTDIQAELEKSLGELIDEVDRRRRPPPSDAKD